MITIADLQRAGATWTETLTIAPKVVTSRGKGRHPTRGTMNKTERVYAEHLERRKIAREVLWYAFEGITLKLADDCRLTPDFIVMLADYTIELHDVKHRWSNGRNGIEDDARVKLAVAAKLFPFRVVAAIREKTNGWTLKEF